MQGKTRYSLSIWQCLPKLRHWITTHFYINLHKGWKKMPQPLLNGDPSIHPSDLISTTLNYSRHYFVNKDIVWWCIVEKTGPCSEKTSFKWVSSQNFKFASKLSWKQHQPWLSHQKTSTAGNPGVKNSCFLFLGCRCFLTQSAFYLLQVQVNTSSYT